MNSSINGTSPTPTAGTSAPAKSGLQITSDQFLSILTAQLSHQDPFNPQDPSESVTQLAALSQISALEDIGNTLKQILANQSTNGDMASWIGRAALVPSTTAAPLKGGEYAGQFLNSSDGDVDVTFQAADGTRLHTIHVRGPVAAGQEFSWDGLVNGVSYPGPAKVSIDSSIQPVAFAMWTPVSSIASPAQSSAMVETPVGSFPPDSVLNLK